MLFLATEFGIKVTLLLYQDVTAKGLLDDLISAIALRPPFFKSFSLGMGHFLECCTLSVPVAQYHLINEDRLQALGNRISCQRRVYASFFEDSCSYVEQQHHLLQHYLVQWIFVVRLFFLFFHLPQNCKYNLI